MSKTYNAMSQAEANGECILTQAVRERYRCPDGFFDFRLGGALSLKSGYFRFGAGTTCYGHALNGISQTEPSSALRDSLSCVSFNGAQLVLPFDPDEVIDNLRLERYAASHLAGCENTLRRIYYRLRPFTSSRLRKYIQRLRAVNWEKKKFPQWPVDTTVESICENLLTLSLRAGGVDCIPFIWFWPAGACGCISMTHDVESKKGLEFCAQLMDIDDSYGIRASFQIVPEGRYSVTPEILGGLRDRGFEVCVQDLNHDGRLFDEREEFRLRAARINRYGREYGAKGYRSAVLYRKPEWFVDLDFCFDMSIPNVAHLDPQRGGCCTVMPYFIGDLLELPVTTTQDYTLFHVLNERSIDLWEKQTEMILAKNGLASFIVHPDYITESEPQALYKTLLALLTEMRRREVLWFALPAEIDKWWRDRSRMSVVKDGESWQIVGEGAERAVLAFAKLVDGKLTYELANPRRGGWPERSSRSVGHPAPAHQG